MINLIKKKYDFLHKEGFAKDPKVRDLLGNFHGESHVKLLGFIDLALISYSAAICVYEKERIIDLAKNVIPTEKPYDSIIESLQKILDRFVFPSHEYLLEEYRKELKEQTKKNKPRLRRVELGGAYRTDYTLFDDSLHLRFVGLQTGEKVGFEIDGRPLKNMVFNALGEMYSILYLVDLAMWQKEFQLMRAINRDSDDDWLFFVAYFEFYKKKKTRRKGYSQTDALDEANDYYHFCDPDSKEWTEQFEKRLNRFKAWIKRDVPFLVRLLDKEKETHLSP